MEFVKEESSKVLNVGFHGKMVFAFAIENGNIQEIETQIIEKTIDCSDENLIEGFVSFNSLGQQSLGINPLGGLLNPPDDARKGYVINEIAREDFRQIQATYNTNAIDRYWAILAHGCNATKSLRRSLDHHK